MDSFQIAPALPDLIDEYQTHPRNRVTLRHFSRVIFIHCDAEHAATVGEEEGERGSDDTVGKENFCAIRYSFQCGHHSSKATFPAHFRSVNTTHKL